MAMRLNITGKKFGNVTAIQPTADRYLDGSVIWRCRCSCGRTFNAASTLLRQGGITHCGCLGHQHRGPVYQRNRRTVAARQSSAENFIQHFLCTYPAREVDA
jgi:hypothetical protein